MRLELTGAIVIRAIVTPDQHHDGAGPILGTFFLATVVLVAPKVAVRLLNRPVFVCVEPDFFEVRFRPR